MSHPHFISHSKIGIPQWDMYAAVTARSTCIVSSIKSRVLAAIVRHPKDPLTHTRRTGCRLLRSPPQWQWLHGQYRRHTTAEVAPQVESDHKDPSGYPKLPKARRLGRVPTGPSSGAPCPYPYDASPECHSRTPYEPQIVRELLLKGSGIKAVFSLALLPRSVAIHEGVLMQCGRRRRLLKPPFSQAD